MPPPLTQKVEDPMIDYIACGGTYVIRCVCVCVCMRACVRACVRVCVRACVPVLMGVPKVLLTVHI